MTLVLTRQHDAKLMECGAAWKWGLRIAELSAQSAFSNVSTEIHL